MASSSSAGPRSDFAGLNAALAGWALRSCIRDGMRLQSAPYAVCLITGACGGLVIAALADLTFDGITATIIIAAFALILALLIQPRNVDMQTIVTAIGASGKRDSVSLPADTRLFPLQRNILALAESRPVLPSEVDWSNLTSRMSHELRTPLNAVIGFSDMLAHGAAGAYDEGQWKEYASHIHQSGLGILKSAEDALVLTSLIASGGAQQSAVSIPVFELFESAAALAGNHAKHEFAETRLSACRSMSVMCADKAATVQALANLLLEAQSRSVSTGHISLDAYTEGGFAVITVSAEKTATRSSVTGDSLNLALARTMLSLTGSQLAVSDDVSGAWRATTILDCAAQAEFF